MPIPILPGNLGSPNNNDPKDPIDPNGEIPLIKDDKLGFQRNLNLPPISFVYLVRQRPEVTLKAFDQMLMDIRIKAETIFRQNYQQVQEEDPEFKKFTKKQEKKMKKRMN